MSAAIIGTVKALTLYPVKSMRGVNVDEAQLYWYGFNGDRKYAFVAADPRSGFPWVTGREVPDLLRYRPYFVTPSDPVRSKVRVETPSGKDLALESPNLPKNLGLPEEASLLKLERGTYDCMPVSLLTTSTLEAVERDLNAPLDSRRFRANIVIEPVNTGVTEEAWQGATLRFGDAPDAARVQVNYPTQRCVMVNLEPETGENNPAVLKTVAQSFDACAGVYAAVQALGKVRVGDEVYKVL